MKRIFLAILTSQAVFMSVGFSAGYMTNQTFNQLINEVETEQKLTATDIQKDLRKEDSVDRRDQILAVIREEMALK